MDPRPPGFSPDRRPRGSLAGTARTIVFAFVIFALLLPDGEATTTTIREDGLLDIDGEVIFPIGLVELGTYAYEDWNDRIRRVGANLVWDIEIAYSDTTPTCHLPEKRIPLTSELVFQPEPFENNVYHI